MCVFAARMTVLPTLQGAYPTKKRIRPLLFCPHVHLYHRKPFLKSKKPSDKT